MLIIIPARLDSSRLPGKVLLEAGGKPLIQWVVEAALAAELGTVCVASDSPEVLSAVSGPIVLVRTGPHSCGSDRAAYADNLLTHQRGSVSGATIVLQADEPMINPEHLWSLHTVSELGCIPRCEIATLCTALDEADQDNPNVVKVDIDNGFVNEFRRTPMRDARRHVGVYAFPSLCLPWFSRLPKTEVESLEQTRALHAGARIRCVEVDHPHHGIDTAEQFEAFKRVVEGGS